MTAFEAYSRVLGSTVRAGDTTGDESFGTIDFRKIGAVFPPFFFILTAHS